MPTRAIPQGSLLPPEAQAGDTAERLPALIQPHHLLPIAHCPDEKSTRVTKKDLKALGCLVEGTQAQGTRGGGLFSFGSRDECQNERENPWDQKLA